MSLGIIRTLASKPLESQLAGMAYLVVLPAQSLMLIDVNTHRGGENWVIVVFFNKHLNGSVKSKYHNIY